MRFLSTARWKAKHRNPQVCTVNAAFQKQGLWGQKDVGQKDTGYLFAQHLSAHNAVVR